MVKLPKYLGLTTQTQKLQLKSFRKEGTFFYKWVRVPDYRSHIDPVQTKVEYPRAWTRPLACFYLKTLAENYRALDTIFFQWPNGTCPCFPTRASPPMHPTFYNCPWKFLTQSFKGPYADHILIPQGSTGSSIFFDIKWKPIFFWLQIQNFSFKFFVVLEIYQKWWN